jgi:helix-turn-helix protein
MVLVLAAVVAAPARAGSQATAPLGLWLPDGSASFAFHPVQRPTVKPLGPLLARRRHALGRSQLRVAELLCNASGMPTVTRHEVSRWEREQRLPSGFWLRWLAVVLELPLDELESAAAVSRARRSRRAG